MQILLGTYVTTSAVADEVHFPTLRLGIEKVIGQPRSMLLSQHESEPIEWFDSQVTTDHSLTYDLNLQWPNGFRLDYRSLQLHSEHSGETKQKICLVGSCFWVADSLIKGLEDNDKVLVELDNHAIWISRDYSPAALSNITISPQIGVNILPATLTVSGTGGEERFQSTLPLPFLGIGIRSNLIGESELFGEFHYLSYQNKKWKIGYQQHQIGAELPVNRALSIAIGYSHYQFGVSRHNHTVNTRVKLTQNRPFIRMGIQF